MANGRLGMLEVIDLYCEIREAVGKVLDKHGIKRGHMNYGLLLSRVQVRNCLVRHEYGADPPPRGEAPERKTALCDRHGMSKDTIERVLYEE